MGDRSRITLNMVKDSANGVFHFGLKADFQPDGGNGWSHIWSEETGKELVSEEKVPIGEWFTLQVSMTAGNKDTGHAQVTLIRNDGTVVPLFDVNDATVYVEDGSLGFTTINPIKVYTAGMVACWLKSQDPSMMLEAWWDDFVLAVTPID